MTELLEQAITTNGGELTEKTRRQTLNYVNEVHKDIDKYTKWIFLGCVFVLWAVSLLLSADADVKCWMFGCVANFRIPEWGVILSMSMVCAIAYRVIMFDRQLTKFRKLLEKPTERRYVVSPSAQISPETSAMEQTGANTQVSTIPYNTAQNSGHLPRRRGDVRVCGYLFFGALLDALQQGLTRDWLRDEWWPGYLERHPDTKYTFNYDAMRDALEAATFIYQPARNQGYKWTRAGAEWIKGAGYTTLPMEAGR